MWGCHLGCYIACCHLGCHVGGCHLGYYLRELSCGMLSKGVVMWDVNICGVVIWDVKEGVVTWDVIIFGGCHLK